MDPVVHFEMPATDRKRMADFYTKVFGWKTELLGGDMREYVVVTTTERDEKTELPKKPGAINGGFYLKSDDPYSQYPSVVIAVDNIDTSLEAVKGAGGIIHGEPYDIPGIGRYAAVIDTEGNRISLLQPYGRSGMG